MVVKSFSFIIFSVLFAYVRFKFSCIMFRGNSFFSEMLCSISLFIMDCISSMSCRITGEIVLKPFLACQHLPFSINLKQYRFIRICKWKVRRKSTFWRTKEVFYTFRYGTLEVENGLNFSEIHLVIKHVNALKLWYIYLSVRSVASSSDCCFDTNNTSRICWCNYIGTFNLVYK